jgi:hypothetical protein
MLVATGQHADAYKSPTIQHGDLVIVYENVNVMKAMYVDKKASFSNKYGNFAQKVPHAARPPPVHG